MLVGLLTPWGEASWLCDYAHKLRRSLEKVGVEVRVISCARQGYETYKDDAKVVRKAWKRNGDMDDVPSMQMAAQSCDLIHAQVAKNIWGNNLESLMVECKKPKIITFHDTAYPQIRQEFFDYAMVTNDLVALDRKLSKPNWFGTFFGASTKGIPEPEVSETLNVLAFGPHCDVDMVEKAVASANSNLGENKLKVSRFVRHWDKTKEIKKRLAGAHIVVSYYPENKKGETAYWPFMAVAAQRPLITSDTEWFRRYSDEYVYKATNLKDLTDGLTFIGAMYSTFLNDARSYMEWVLENRTWPKVAQMHLDVYEEVLKSHENLVDQK